MPSSIAIMNARNFVRDGGAFGNYIATSYELQGERVLLVALCNECGAKNRIPWSHVSVEARTRGTVLCVNRERHKAVATPAAPDWRTMTDAQFRAYVKSLPSDQYLTLSKNAAFAARDAEQPNTYIDRKEAISRKAAADYEAAVGPIREWWTRLYFVCMGDASVNPPVPPRSMPVKSLEEFAALKPADQERIIAQYGLRENDGMVKF
jgi:hypothetical protein